MHFIALLLLVQAPAPAPSPGPVLVDIHDLSPREHQSGFFVLTAAQEVQITAVGAEPWPDRLRQRNDENWQNDEQTTWPAAAWILDAHTRAVVWDLRSADTRRESNGLRHFSGNVRLPAGTYEAHYASYPAALRFNDDVNISSFNDVIRLGRRAKSGGPYVENGLYKQFGLTITGPGRVASEEDITAARAVFRSSAIASVVPEQNGTARKGFEITRPTRVQLYAIGEMTVDEEFDYGWIVNADTRKRIWSMTYETTDPAGGAVKNRMAQETLDLKRGHYVAYFASDDNHNPDDWNNVPPADPDFWGLTLRVTDPAARATVRPFEYEPVPAGQTIVSMIGVHDDEMRSAGFTLKRPMDLHIYALGEGFKDRMADYAWIMGAEQHKRVWSMDYRNTEHAGGAEKNRLFDGTVHFAAGDYLVYYRSDGSHSSDDWNAAPPAEGRYWGISVFPASGRLNRADVTAYERPGRPNTAALAELNHMGNDEQARQTFSVPTTTRLRIVAIGEGRDDEMFDYGSIEDANGRTVWEMKYEETEPAGGADKNRMYDGVITLRPGDYVLRYRSDGSHSYNDWNDSPPDDPESWGIAVFRTARR